MSTSHYLELECLFTPASPDQIDEQFEAFLDCVLEALEDIGRTEVDVVASLRDHRAIFTERVPSAGVDEAAQFITDLRTALHSAKCSTPNWPSLKQFLGMKSRDADLANA